VRALADVEIWDGKSSVIATWNGRGGGETSHSAHLPSPAVANSKNASNAADLQLPDEVYSILNIYI
jgi:hypothetical protein